VPLLKNRHSLKGFGLDHGQLFRNRIGKGWPTIHPEPPVSPGWSNYEREVHRYFYPIPWIIRGVALPHTARRHSSDQGPNFDRAAGRVTLTKDTIRLRYARRYCSDRFLKREQELLAGEGQLSGILALGVSTLHPNKRN